MSKYEPKDGDIAVFKNKDKKSETHPDWTGRALIDGVEKDISLWMKSDTMLAGVIKEKWTPDFQEAKPAEAPPQDSNIPF